MIRVITFTHQGMNLPVFIDDTETGYNGRDVLSKPGIYDDLASDDCKYALADLSGSINGYSTKCMALLAIQTENPSEQFSLQDCTEQVKQLLIVPETAAKMMINNMPEDQREFAQTALDVIHYYESVTPETKVFLPEDAMSLLDAEVAAKMRSNRRAYVLKHSDNQEIVQKDCTSVFGIPLPQVEELHSKTDCSPKALDILRVIAPCRKPVGDKGVFQYNGIYHTPYYRIDPKIRGAIPSYLEFLRGYHKNDTLDIQNNERHMRDNLRTFVQADIAMYVSEIATALYLSTKAGLAIKKLLACKNEELLPQLISEISEYDEHGVKCSISYSDIKDAVADGMSIDKIAATVAQHVSFDPEALTQMVTAQLSISRVHVADIENLPFVLNISDELKSAFTETFISNSVITRAMMDYLLDLCVRAYEVNWGHTGATRAISRFVNNAGINIMNDVLGAYLSQTLGGITAPISTDFTLLYNTQQKVSEDEEFDDGDDGLFVDFDYYITNDTAMKIRAGMSTDLFSSNVSAAETSETAIVEYWRKVDGSSNLQYFISGAFTTTGDLDVILEAFIKLMRWGSVKPALLVFQDKPNIRTVFDLNTGKEIPNTAIVDETQLVLSNGCQYSLEAVLTAEDVMGAKPIPVGLLLSKNYGIKKFFLASFVDLGEMVEHGAIDIDAFKTVKSVSLREDDVVPIASLENSGYAFLTSNRNIELGLEYGIAPAQLSELALLCTGGILRSADYLRSKQNTMTITTKDRQYQILSAYCDVLRSVFSEEQGVLEATEVSTPELSALAAKVYKTFVEGGKKQAPGVNQVRAQQVVMNMQLETDNAKVLDCPLVGKFTIVSDMEMQSALPAIEFSDPSMQQVSKKVRDRIVMLMLETQDAFVLCRKDIAPADLLVVDHKIEHRKYSAFTAVISALLSGQTVNLSNSKTGAKHPVYLHPSLRELL